ncbi:TetR/AcrR family transcriptional regulator [Erythrobacter sp. SG61-1L]|uniref:TetR/AcrR family transcriptional regulator n=1 Tax=Erythrobacter sp. SG61-1L TaxID=1603897 RepID=UPI0006C909C0|nr:TetR/AcrR family transcriptional regulator [Erythrobacter sp. SG61-1L]
MGRRSDHTREELREMLVALGHAHMAEAGLARFSGREVAKRAGYSVGTIYNVFGSLDTLIAAINTRTFGLWADHLRSRLASGEPDRIRLLVEGYFTFAFENSNLWNAIFDHHLPADFELSEADRLQRGELTAIVIEEIAAILPAPERVGLPRLAASLVAVVHGHCAFAVSGSFALMEEPDPIGAAYDRVCECLTQVASGGRSPGSHWAGGGSSGIA